MRILLISNIFPPEFIGGYELVAADLAMRLAQDGHQVLVLTSHMSGETQEADWPFSVARTLQCLTQSPDALLQEDKRWRGGVVNVNNLKTIAQALRLFQPTAVLCCNLAGLGPFGILKFLTQLGLTPALYLGDNIFDNGLDVGAERTSFLNYLDIRSVMTRIALMPVSQTVLTEVGDYLSLALVGVLTVPGWVDGAHASPELPVRKLPTPIRFLFCSRIAPHKGINILLDAVEILRQCGETDFIVDLYGAGEVGITMQRVEMQGLSDLIRYQGMKPKSEMIGCFRDYDALLFPTWEREPFGFVVAEAAYQGCIPIMTSTCGAAEWFVDDANCIKIDRTAVALAEAMLRLQHMLPERRHRMSKETKSAARMLFDFEHWYRKIVDVLGTVGSSQVVGDIATELNALTLQLRLFR